MMALWVFCGASYVAYVCLKVMHEMPCNGSSILGALLSGAFTYSAWMVVYSIVVLFSDSLHMPLGHAVAMTAIAVFMATYGRIDRNLWSRRHG